MDEFMHVLRCVGLAAVGFMVVNARKLWLVAKGVLLAALVAYAFVHAVLVDGHPLLYMVSPVLGAIGAMIVRASRRSQTGQAVER